MSLTGILPGSESSGDRGNLARYALSAFGMRIASREPITGATDLNAVDAPADVQVEPQTASVDDFAGPGAPVYERRKVGGERYFTVHGSEDGFHLWFERFGNYTVAANGSVVTYPASVRPAWRERFLFAQALPLAATLRGFELLHCAAVVIHGATVALAGDSGVGKSSLALELIRSGNALMTDDALSLTLDGESVVAHPGGPFMAVPMDRRHRLDSLPPGTGDAVGSADKIHYVPGRQGRPSRLDAVYHLERGTTLDIRPLPTEDVARRLLAGSSVPYVTSHNRLERQLHLVQSLARDVRHFQLVTPSGESALESATAALESHSQSGLAHA
jgi:hypothetical protein